MIKNLNRCKISFVIAFIIMFSSMFYQNVSIDVSAIFIEKDTIVYVEQTITCDSEITSADISQSLVKEPGIKQVKDTGRMGNENLIFLVCRDMPSIERQRLKCQKISKELKITQSHKKLIKYIKDKDGENHKFM